MKGLKDKDPSGVLLKLKKFERTRPEGISDFEG